MNTTYNPGSLLRDQDTDASKWAEAYAATHGGDIATLILWFACAIETGKDAGRYPNRPS